MTPVQALALGIAIFALGIIFVCLIREQITNTRTINAMLAMNSRLMDQHERILEHLMIGSDPDAWRVKQLDNFRKDRQAEADKQPTPDGWDEPAEGID